MHGVDRVDDERAVDRHAHPHVVHRLAGRAHAGQQLVVVVLDVDQLRLDVEQAVVALPAFVDDACARAGARAGRWQVAAAWGIRCGERDGRIGRRRRRARCAATMRRKTLILRCRAALPQPRAAQPGGRHPDALRPRPRPGHDQFARDRLRPRGHRPRRRAAGVPADLPAARLGRARRRPRSGRRSRACCTRRWPRPASAPRDIAAIGITNQRETTVLWDRATGRPVANAIVWQDRRTAPLLRRAARRRPRRRLIAAQDRARARRVLLRHQAQVAARPRARRARARAQRGELAFGTIDSLARLEPDRRRACTSPTRRTRAARCSSTSTRGDWDDELLRAARRPARGAAARRRRRRACARTARLDGVDVPIAGIAGDQQAALFGQACHAPGLAKNTYGTGCFLLLNTGAKRGRVGATTC